MLKYSINFSLHKRNNDNSTLIPIRMRVSFNSQRPDFYTGVSIEEIHWNAETQRSYSKRSIENRELDKLETIIEDIFENFEYELKRFPNVQELREAFKVSTNKKPSTQESSISLQQLFEMYIEKVGTLHQWTPGTTRKYHKLKNHLFYYNKDLKLDFLTEKDILGFIDYCQKGPIDHVTHKKKDPHRNTTIVRNFSDLNSILRWGANEGHYNGNLHNTVKQKFKGSAGDLKDIIFLTWNELMKLYEADNLTEAQGRVRDVFCFQCFTGMRYSDVFKFKKNQIKDDHIFITTEKTIDPIKIDLNDYSREILVKYENSIFPENKALPVISGQKFNKILKKIAELLEFDEEINEVYFVGSKRHDINYKKYEKISSHAGRRTFVVNGLTLGIPDKVIMKWTGHKDFSAMKPYVKIVDELKKSEMSKFNKKK